MTHDPHDAKVSLGHLRRQRRLNRARLRSLSCHIVDTACCGAGGDLPLSGRAGQVRSVAPEQADVLVIAGSVTAGLAHEVRALYDRMPHPKWVVAVGACACDGGPFREYPNVAEGLRGIVPVDVWVPGCPPTAEAVEAGFVELRERVQRRMEERIASRR